MRWPSVVCVFPLLAACPRSSPEDDKTGSSEVAVGTTSIAPVVPAQPPRASTTTRATDAREGPCPAGMVLVPGGAWTQPQLDGFARWNREVQPEAQLVFAERVEPFCLDVHEFTWDRYAACMRAGQCPPADEKRGWIAHALPERAKPLDADERARVEADTADKPTQARKFVGHPVTNISSLEALEICEGLGGSLPTLEQWLWAYRGGEENRASPWGDAPADVTRANLCDRSCQRWEFYVNDDEDCESRACKAASKLLDDGYVETAPVGSFPKGAGRWGHLDLEGNAEEIVTVRVSALAEKRRQPEARTRMRAGVFRSWCGSVFHQSAAKRKRNSHAPWFPCWEGGGRPLSDDVDTGTGDFGPSEGFRCARQPAVGSPGNDDTNR